MSYQKTSWKESIKKAQTPFYKKALHPIRRQYDSYRLRAECENFHVPCVVTRVVGESGFSIPYKRRWALRGVRDIGRKVMLVQGTGNGWDVVTWARFRPQKIYAVDMFEFDDWKDIRSYCKDRWNVDVEFVRGSIEDSCGIKDHSLDLVVSDAVYEHCVNFSNVIKKTHGLLKVGGMIYANYGPLYYCASGDHFSGRETLASSYNHIVLNKNEYENYVDNNLNTVENYQDGARYIELDLFSKMTTGDYISAYKEFNLEFVDFWVEISSRAMAFRNTFPDKYELLVKSLPEKVDLCDLFIKSHHIRLMKTE